MLHQPITPQKKIRSNDQLPWWILYRHWKDWNSIKSMLPHYMAFYQRSLLLCSHMSHLLWVWGQVVLSEAHAAAPYLICVPSWTASPAKQYIGFSFNLYRCWCILPVCLLLPSFGMNTVFPVLHIVIKCLLMQVSILHLPKCHYCPSLNHLWYLNASEYSTE